MKSNTNVKILTISNRKRGVGKTTSASTIGYFISMEFQSPTLLVDTDPKGQLGPSLGLKKSNGLNRLVVDGEPIHKVVVQCQKNLYIIPNDPNEVHQNLENHPHRENILANIFRATKDFDFIIFDMAPKLDAMLLRLLSISDWLIMPCTLDYFSLDGVNCILKTVESLRHYPNVSDMRVLGILPTMFENTKVDKEYLFKLQYSLGNNIVLPIIPKCNKVEEARSRGLAIWDYDSQCSAITGYTTHLKTKIDQRHYGGYFHLMQILTPILKKGR